MPDTSAYVATFDARAHRSPAEGDLTGGTFAFGSPIVVEEVGPSVTVGARAVRWYRVRGPGIGGWVRGDQLTDVALSNTEEGCVSCEPNLDDDDSSETITLAWRDDRHLVVRLRESSRRATRETLDLGAFPATLDRAAASVVEEAGAELVRVDVTGPGPGAVTIWASWVDDTLKEAKRDAGP